MTKIGIDILLGFGRFRFFQSLGKSRSEETRKATDDIDFTRLWKRRQRRNGSLIFRRSIPILVYSPDQLTKHQLSSSVLHNRKILYNERSCPHFCFGCCKLTQKLGDEKNVNVIRLSVWFQLYVWLSCGCVMLVLKSLWIVLHRYITSFHKLNIFESNNSIVHLNMSGFGGELYSIT